MVGLPVTTVHLGGKDNHTLLTGLQQCRPTPKERRTIGAIGRHQNHPLGVGVKQTRQYIGQHTL